MEWIKTEDNQPDDNITVLMFGPGTDDVIPGFMEGGEWFDFNGWPYAPKAISHWMNLPEPPEDI